MYAGVGMFHTVKATIISRWPAVETPLLVGKPSYQTIILSFSLRHHDRLSFEGGLRLVAKYLPIDATMESEGGTCSLNYTHHIESHHTCLVMHDPACSLARSIPLHHCIIDNHSPTLLNGQLHWCVSPFGHACVPTTPFCEVRR